jgi:glycosyltransferase involved in cell wall biosynthesis
MMKKYKADLMYFFALGAGTFIAPVSGKLSNIPILIRANDTIVKGLYPSVLKFLDRLLIKITDLIVVPSLFLKNLMVEELSIDSTKISVIPNAIDLAPFRGKKNRVSAKNSLGISKDTKVIGMVANLLPVKAPDVLIRAVPEVVKKTPDTVFVLAGDGPLQPDLELLAENLRVSKHVRFLGYRSDIADVVAAFDIGVMCSKVETHGISILEMMAAGVPVIAPEVGGIPEIIRHEENGFLLPQGDSDRLAEAIVRLLKRSDFAREMGKRAHEMVFDHFSVDRMVYSMEQLFLEFS